MPITISMKYFHVQNAAHDNIHGIHALLVILEAWLTALRSLLFLSHDFDASQGTCPARPNFTMSLISHLPFKLTSIGLPLPMLITAHFYDHHLPLGR